MRVSMVIKTNRIKMGLTQVQLGKKIGYTNQMIYNLEKGLCLLPLSKVKIMAKALGLDVSYLKDIASDEKILRVLNKSSRG